MNKYTYIVRIIDHATVPKCLSSLYISKDGYSDQTTEDICTSKRIYITESGRRAASLRLNYISADMSLAFDRGGICTNTIKKFADIVELEYGKCSIGSDLYIIFYAIFKEMIRERIELIRISASPEIARHLKLVGLSLEEVAAPKSTSGPLKNYWIRADKSAFHIFYRQLPSRDTAILRMIEAGPNEKYGNPRNVLPVTAEEQG